jgi:ribosomal protein S18 acetylase RimI-like enzyme
VSIRAARADDARAIATAHVRSWQAAYRGLIPQDYLDSLDPEHRVARWAARLSQVEGGWPRTGVLVAQEADQVVGFAGFSPVRDPDLDPATVGELTTIYLLPQAWGQGHGRELMAAALAALRQAGYREAVLWVLDSNDRARRFYLAAGWRADGGAKQVDLDGTGFPLSEVRYRHPLTGQPSPS